MNREELFKRTKDILNPSRTAKEVFTFIGVGSGGARVAEEAARFGVGSIILVDRPNETLEEHNIIRHVLGYRDLGRPKVEALRDHILNINPTCSVEIINLDVVKNSDRVLEIVCRSTQVHLCTDNEKSKYVVNEAAVKAGVPLMFAAVFDGGCGGEAGRVMPGGACYACIASYLNRSGKFDEDEIETFDYSDPHGLEKSTAALNLDISQIALLQARVGLLTVIGKEDPEMDFQGNYILFGNRAVEGLFPCMLCSDIWEIPKDPNCLICSQDNMTESEINATAEDIFQKTVCKIN